MKSLYEFRNGYVSESYVRAYVWADTPEEAKALFLKRHPNQANNKIISRTLMDADAPAFCTLLTDSGWETFYSREGHPTNDWPGHPMGE